MSDTRQRKTATLVKQWLHSSKKEPPSAAGYLFDFLSCYPANFVAKFILGVAASLLAVWIERNPKNISEQRSLGAAQVLCCGVLALLLISTAICCAADGKQSSWDKSSELKAAGYTELSGADAVNFLVGNSVVVHKSDAIDRQNGIEINEKIYYFLNDRTMYDCGAIELGCLVGPWAIKGSEICYSLGGCEPYRVLKSPQSEDWANNSGRLGIYLVSAHWAYDIVKGNWTAGPLFDSHGSGHLIELNRADLDKEIRNAAKYSGGDTAVPISGPRAISLLIGNTFLPKETATLSKGDIMKCPAEGVYYSPDGKVIGFSCGKLVAGGESWSLNLSHWKIVSGLFCRDAPDPDGSGFGCSRKTVTAIPAAKVSGTNDKMVVLDFDGGIIDFAPTGYAGNVFNFRFEDQLRFDKSENK